MELFLAGERGFEPLKADPESAVLPLDDSPISHNSKDERTINFKNSINYELLSKVVA